MSGRRDENRVTGTHTSLTRPAPCVPALGEACVESGGPDPLDAPHFGSYLLEPASSPAFTPDGHHLVFDCDCNPQGVFIMRDDGTDRHRVTTHAFAFQPDLNAEVSPDGVGCEKADHPAHAACSYSCMRPPRRSLRTIALRGMGSLISGLGESGIDRSKPR